MMSRFLTSLCLNGVRTSDHLPLDVVNAQTLALNGRLVAADDIVELALPSKVATAMMTSMAAAPAYCYSVYLLLGAQVHRGRFGDAVIHSIIREQARRRSSLDDPQVAFGPVMTRAPKHNGTSPASLQYEECLLFALDDGAVACETLRASDAPEAVDELLRTLRIISLAIFKCPGNKTCVVLVSPHLSTAHMAALLLACRRHVFLYLDETMSVEEMLETIAEMRQVRESLSSFSAPLALDAERAQRMIAGDHSGAAPLQMSALLDALAHTDGEYKVFLAALAREWTEQQEQRSSPPSRGPVTVTGDGETGSVVQMEMLRKELEGARAAQRATEDVLADQLCVHRDEMLSLRAELESAQRRGDDNTVFSESLNKSTVNGRAVSKNLLQSFQQQEHSHNSLSRNDTSSSMVSQLQKALGNALKAQRFAEEKVRLLELRQSLTASSSQVAPITKGNASGDVTSPRPSLRLQPATATSVAAPSPPATAPPAWEQKLLQQENTALVAEFQRKEKEWQQQLRQASAEVAQLQQERLTMVATLQLQSQTIAAAQRALLNSRVSQEQEMSQTLEHVRVLSQELRSRHRSETHGFQVGPERP
ncbi:hypothetical protein JKF63_03082 [Porcisia hertigi]|uniref:Uncharacterized protein n=1 Tax=Porcisia hertigi TaxID=2761500 RepID=A0A836INK1_9TRYP|nr:hypothetical protein JKF63_03082 [Porcisia hertigi]